MMWFIFQCLNKDGVEIKLDVTYQYKVRAVNLRTVILDFRNFTGYKKVLTFAGWYAWLLIVSSKQDIFIY